MNGINLGHARMNSSDVVLIITHRPSNPSTQPFATWSRRLVFGVAAKHRWMKLNFSFSELPQILEPFKFSYERWTPAWFCWATAEYLRLVFQKPHNAPPLIIDSFRACIFSNVNHKRILIAQPIPLTSLGRHPRRLQEKLEHSRCAGLAFQ